MAHPPEPDITIPALRFSINCMKSTPCRVGVRYADAKNSPLHGHGTSWAIDGQADGETVMTDLLLVEAASPDKPGGNKRVVAPNVRHPPGSPWRVAGCCTPHG